MNASAKPYELNFTQPVLTSRGEMKKKNGCFVTLEKDGVKGIGECSYIEGLSMDEMHTYHQVLKLAEADPITAIHSELDMYPSIRFGLEMALLDLNTGGQHKLFPSAFTDGTQRIAINGLIWMGDETFLHQQIQDRLAQGYKCLKLKVGALPFEQEIATLHSIRLQYSPLQLELRLDANGAFTEQDVFEKLEQLTLYGIHSIEQPIRPGQHRLMNTIVEAAIIPIALDEELIGITTKARRSEMLEAIKPNYIILKPSLLGGFAVCEEWIELAKQNHLNWWATSALESNIGLNAIAQWVFTKEPTMAQGLGTGSLYSNNIDSPLFVANGELGYDPSKTWGTFE